MKNLLLYFVFAFVFFLFGCWAYLIAINSDKQLQLIIELQKAQKAQKAQK